MAAWRGPRFLQTAGSLRRWPLFFSGRGPSVSRRASVATPTLETVRYRSSRTRRRGRKLVELGKTALSTRTDALSPGQFVVHTETGLVGVVVHRWLAPVVNLQIRRSGKGQDALTDTKNRRPGLIPRESQAPLPMLHIPKARRVYTYEAMQNMASLTESVVAVPTVREDSYEPWYQVLLEVPKAARSELDDILMGEGRAHFGWSHRLGLVRNLDMVKGSDLVPFSPSALRLNHACFDDLFIKGPGRTYSTLEMCNWARDTSLALRHSQVFCHHSEFATVTILPFLASIKGMSDWDGGVRWMYKVHVRFHDLTAKKAKLTHHTIVHTDPQALSYQVISGRGMLACELNRENELELTSRGFSATSERPVISMLGHCSFDSGIFGGYLTFQLSCASLLDSDSFPLVIDVPLPSFEITKQS